MHPDLREAPWRAVAAATAFSFVILTEAANLLPFPLRPAFEFAFRGSHRQRRQAPPCVSCFKPATLNSLFRLNLLIFALKIEFVLGSFFAQKIAKSCVANKSLSSFPRFSIFLGNRPRLPKLEI
jgi:hypothetical protein